MSKTEACDAALLKASRENPEVRSEMDEMMAAQMEFNDQLAEDMVWDTVEADLPGNVRIDPKQEAEYRASMEAVYKAETGDTATGWKERFAEWYEAKPSPWEAFKQARVALMLSNPLTHLKNVTATGGQAVVVRPLEEAMGILVSRLKPGHESRSFWEMYHYAGGALRASQDGIMMFRTLGKLLKERKFLEAEEFRLALKDAGYGGALAHGKPDIVLNKAMDRPRDSDNFVTKGSQYLFNALFGSQFSLLQSSDTVFKMISHRAKVQQLLSRKGAKEGLVGESLNDYVAENWQKMSDDVRAGKKYNPETEAEFANIQQTGFTQAAEDTFTQTPQTDVGRFLSGNTIPNTGWGKPFSESVQILAPFRQIYINLMRQTFSRRLTPFLDKQTRDEIMGRRGKEAQELAMGRTAGALTLVAGSAALIQQGGIKVHGPDDVDPQVRQMQFEMYGKVGNTIQIQDQYFPVDSLPPGISIPLAYIAVGMQAYEEENYRYVDEEDRLETAMRMLGPMMTAVTDGPWVKEYLDFVAKTSSYFQYGNPGGFLNHMGSVIASPMAMPKWIQNVVGIDQSMKTTDGIVDKFRTDMLLRQDSFGYKRNMFGRKIPPMQRVGPQKHYPWHGGDSDVMAFLASANYDKVYRSNVSMSIGGNGNDSNLIDDAVEMNAKERDRFEYYVGQSRISGMTLQEQIRMYMGTGVYDSKQGKLMVHPTTVQADMAKIISKRRQTARTLMKYNPRFKIREKQIARFYRALIQDRNVPKGQADQWKQQQEAELNQVRMQLKDYF